MHQVLIPLVLPTFPLVAPLELSSLWYKLVLQALRSIIAGGKGNDSIYLGDQLATFDKTSVNGGAGNDILGTYNSGASTAGDVAQFTGGEIRGGKGNDTVFVTVSAASATDFKVVGNAGVDSVAFSATNEANSGFVGGGADADSVHFARCYSIDTTIKGGDGNDTINVASTTTTTRDLIEGDSIDAGTGVDTLNLDLGTVSATSVYGGDGNDSIVLSGLADGGSNLYAGLRC